MRKWIRAILLCLILGVVTTVGVAWGALHLIVGPARPAQLDTSVLKPGEAWSNRITTVGLGVEVVSSMDGPIQFRPALMTLGEGGFDQVEHRSSVRAGWPFYSVGTTQDFYLTGLTFGTSPGSPVWTDLRILGRRADEPWYAHAEQFHALWPGFLINTFFYAAIWFGILFGFTTLRRTIRRRRGRCSMCAYDLRGEFKEGCSECGWNRRAGGADA